jgi:hypothetical protein
MIPSIGDSEFGRDSGRYPLLRQHLAALGEKSIPTDSAVKRYANAGVVRCRIREALGCTSDLRMPNLYRFCNSTNLPTPWGSQMSCAGQRCRRGSGQLPRAGGRRGIRRRSRRPVFSKALCPAASWEQGVSYRAAGTANWSACAAP